MVRLAPAINEALNAQVTINEIKEAFSQLYAYTGFPRSLNALGVLNKVLESRKQKGVKDNEGKAWQRPEEWKDRKSTRLNSSHANISYAVFCLKKKKYTTHN